jgi:hypothetical protein
MRIGTESARSRASSADIVGREGGGLRPTQGGGTP